MANQTPRPPILGSFEDIGEQVKEEITKLPGDMVGQALESVGLNIGGKKQTPQNNTPAASQDPSSAWQQIDKQQDEQTKRTIARRALEELTQPTPKQKEPSIWEKIQQEEDQKNELEKQKQAAAKPVALPSSGARKVPGIKSAVKSKQSSEIGKNVKQD